MTSVSSYGAHTRARNPYAGDPCWIHARFERAVDIIQSLPKSGPIQTNYDDKLLLYAVYKQATEGDITTSRPGMFDVLGRAKWDAWNKRKGLSQADAERLYVEALMRILRGYSDRTHAVQLLRDLEDFTVPRRTGGARQVVSTSQPPPTRNSEPYTRGLRTLALSSNARSVSRPSSRSTSSSDSSTEASSSSEFGGRTGGRRGGAGSRHRRDEYNAPSSRARSRRGVVAADDDERFRHGGGGGGNRVHPPPPPPADLVAPSLPGYGPPRTRQDSVRMVQTEEGEEHDDLDRDYETSSDGDDDGRDDDDGATGPYASVPPTAPSSVVHHHHEQQDENRRASSPRRDAAPPSSQHGSRTLAPPLDRSTIGGGARASSARTFRVATASLVGNNSPSPSVYSINPDAAARFRGSRDDQEDVGSQQYVSVAGALPLTTSNLMQQRGGDFVDAAPPGVAAVVTTTPRTITPSISTPTAVQAQTLTRIATSTTATPGGGGGARLAPQQHRQQQQQQGTSTPAVVAPALDAALDRIQTSLTALHERLSILESGGHRRRDLTLSSSSLAAAGAGSRESLGFRDGSTGAVTTWLKLSILELLILFHLRSPTRPGQQQQQEGGRARVWTSLRTLVGSLLPRLAIAIVQLARRVVGDVAFAFVVVVVVTRVRDGRRRSSSSQPAVGQGGIRSIFESIVVAASAAAASRSSGGRQRIPQV
ncbi:hypothetical protein JCM3766R1_003292 [Sporobolomyces carnicolor]